MLRLTDAAVKRLIAASQSVLELTTLMRPFLAWRFRVQGLGRPATGAEGSWTRISTVHGGKQRRLTFEPGYPALSPCRGSPGSDEGAASDQGRHRSGRSKRRRPGKQPSRAPDTIANVVETFIRLDLERRNRAPRYITETRRIFKKPRAPAMGRARHQVDHTARRHRSA